MKQFNSTNFLFLTLLLLIAGCANLDQQLETIKPTAKLLGTRLTNINFEQADLMIELLARFLLQVGP